MTTAAEAQAELDRRAAAANGKPLQMGPTRAEAAAELQRRQASQQTEQGFMSRAGDVAGDLAKSALSGVARGVRNTVQLPAMIGGTIDRGFEKIGLAPEGFAADMRDQGILSSQNIGDFASTITGGGTDFQPETRAGRFAQTGADFATSGGLLGGAKGLVRGGLIPGVASETAGQLTEGTAAEPIARTVAALGAGIAATPRAGTFRGADESARMANTLEGAGVRNVTTGQMRGSEGLMRAEGRLAPSGAQIDDFTESTMRQLGSSEKLATPATLQAVEQRIVKQMDDAVQGVNITPSSGQAMRALKIGTDYAERVPVGTLTPRVRGIANELRALAVSGDTVPLSRLRTWRSDIGKLTTSNDSATREAAHGLRSLIDEMTDGALTAAGRTDDIASLAASRTSYRDFIGVRDASTRAGAERGTLSPTALNQSIIRSQGRESYALGRGTPMQDFSRAGAAILRPAPTVSPGSNRNFALPGGLAAFGGTAGFAIGGVPGAILGAGAAQSAPSAGQAIMRSNAMQSLLRDPTSIPRQAVPMLPGLLSQDRR